MYLSNQDPEPELNFLTELFSETLTPEQFCNAHELVNRNHITSQKKKIIKESHRFALRPFRFLINKN